MNVIKRRNYFKAKNLHCPMRSVEIQSNIIRSSRLYKRDTIKQFHTYRKEFIAKLRDLCTSDPKAYWSLLNKTNNTGNNAVEKEALETFYDNFKILIITNVDEHQEFYFDNKHLEDEQNVELNNVKLFGHYESYQVSKE